MLSSLKSLATSLTYPPTLTFWLLAAGALLLVLGRRRLAGAAMACGLAWSLLWSIPQASDWLRSPLESRYASFDEAELPRADAIVVLGGGSSYRWLAWPDVRPEQLKSSRLAAGARAWQAGRAPIVILSGGGDGGRSEARTMAVAIQRLGVPPDVLVLEEHSRNTRDNARCTARLAERHDVQRILLVTSSLHMPRAMLSFRHSGLDIVPVPVPEHAPRHDWRERWLPSRSALHRSSRALKEYIGLLAAFLGR